jgi:arylsulfatase A-like enzyme
MIMERRCFLKSLAATGLATGLALRASAGKKALPNIVWIFSDDHSYQTIGAYGGMLEELNPTPTIDKLAQDGMRFDKCYVENSICAPSRATLLTGKFSHMHGKKTNRGGFNQDQQTFPKILQSNGYQTAMIGKIHLAGNLQGFDYWEVLPGQGLYTNPRFITENGASEYEGHSTDIISDKALEWLRDKRDPGKPFMAMIHYKAPHRNWIPAERFMDKYADVSIPEPANLFDDYATRGRAARAQNLSIEKTMTLHGDVKIFEGEQRKSEGGLLKKRQFARRNEQYGKLKPQGRDLVKLKYQLYMKDYLRCIWGIDQNVKRILDYLDASGLSENTVVMYSSDQGFYMGEHGWFDKRFMYEESFRTPLIARWPGVVPPGSVNSDLVQNIDFAETFLDIAGAPIPDDMQGRSLLPLLKGERPADWRDSLYYHYYEHPTGHRVLRHEGVADKHCKLIRFYGPGVPNGEEWEFYDLHIDPNEMNNRYGSTEYADKILAMKSELERLREYFNVPQENEN